MKSVLFLLLALGAIGSGQAQTPAAPAQPPGAATGAGRGAPPAPAVVVPPGKPTVILWPNGAPGSEARHDEAEEIQGETVRNVHNPSMVVFLPPKQVNTGVA